MSQIIFPQVTCLNLLFYQYGDEINSLGLKESSGWIHSFPLGQNRQKTQNFCFC